MEGMTSSIADALLLMEADIDRDLENAHHQGKLPQLMKALNMSKQQYRLLSNRAEKMLNNLERAGQGSSSRASFWLSVLRASSAASRGDFSGVSVVDAAFAKGRK